ncbi:hypothetical protein ACLDWC_14100, partial [Acinetobacter baumannii]
SSPQQIYGIRSTTYPSYALNLAQLGALCISNLCATKSFRIIKYWFNNNHKYILIGHSAHLSKNLIKYPKWLNIIIEIHKSTYFNP